MLLNVDAIEECWIDGLDQVTRAADDHVGKVAETVECSKELIRSLENCQYATQHGCDAFAGAAKMLLQGIARKLVP